MAKGDARPDRPAGQAVSQSVSQPVCLSVWCDIACPTTDNDLRQSKHPEQPTNLGVAIRPEGQQTFKAAVEAS